MCSSEFPRGSQVTDAFALPSSPRARAMRPISLLHLLYYFIIHHSSCPLMTDHTLPSLFRCSFTNKILVPLKLFLFFNNNNKKILESHRRGLELESLINVENGYSVLKFSAHIHDLPSKARVSGTQLDNRAWTLFQACLWLASDGGDVTSHLCPSGSVFITWRLGGT